MVTVGPSPPPGSGQRLDSWKAIAQYLNRDIRTVVRWEKERNLPVRRVPGGRARTVFAYTGDLQAWLESAEPDAGPDISSPPRRRWVLSAALIATTIGAAAILVVNQAWSSPIARVAAVQDALAGLDGRGNPLWRFDVPGLAEREFWNPRLARVQDIDGDGQADVLAALELSPLSGLNEGRLVALDRAGRARWQRVPDHRLRFGDTEYGPPWYPHDLEVYGSTIAWAVHHHTWWPAVVETLDPAGRPLGRFVNTGWIHRLDVTLDRRQLLAAGVSNELGGAILAVLDAASIDGSSPPPPGAASRCRACPAGSPVMYFLVPWSDVAHASRLGEGRTHLHVLPSGHIEFRSVQIDTADGTPEVIVELNETFVIVRREVSDSFWGWHTSLERSGELDHTAAACPLKAGPPVQVWTPAAGWHQAR